MNRNSIGSVIMAAFLAMALVDTALAQDYTVTEEDVKGDEPDYSPYVDRNIPTQVFWGDTHLHTSNSPDAGMIGNTLGPDEAYRFSRGEEVTTSTGLRAKLIRPLDFLVVSDHAEYSGDVSVDSGSYPGPQPGQGEFQSADESVFTLC